VDNSAPEAVTVYEDGTFTGSVDVDGGTIVNLVDPTDEQDAATKNYVDTELDSYLNSEEGTEGTTILYVQDYVETAIETGDATATPTYFALDINSIAKQVATQSTGDGVIVAGGFSPNSFRSAKYLVRIERGAHTQLSEVLITLDTSNNIAITEYAVVGTNGNLGDISATLNIGVVMLEVTVPSTSTVTVYGTLLA
jgi:hypothetical protein